MEEIKANNIVKKKYAINVNNYHISVGSKYKIYLIILIAMNTTSKSEKKLQIISASFSSSLYTGKQTNKYHDNSKC